MADKRKLQGEIDRCHKKVQEGCDVFDDIWDKFNTSTTINQKEKFEADLKREIKKLQRLRDNIKTWLNTSEIRDKQQLQENRKKIENRMERFKVVEKETKTKAFSKEGLGASTKLDPVAQEKRKIETWLQDSINSLEIQIEQLESEVESLSNTGNKKKNKVDKQKEERLLDLRNKIERHRFHTTQLETLLRMLNNDAIDVQQIKDIQEDVNYYVESNQDDGFEENEYLYDDLDLDDENTEQFVVQAVVAHTDTNHSSNSSTTTSADTDSHHSTSHPAAIDARSRHRSSTNSDEGKSNGSAHSSHSNKPSVVIPQSHSYSQRQQSVTSQLSHGDSISISSSSVAGSSVPSTPLSSFPSNSVPPSPFSSGPSSSLNPSSLSALSSSSAVSNSTTSSTTTFSSAVTVPSSPQPQQPQLISYSNAAASAATSYNADQSGTNTRLPVNITTNSINNGPTSVDLLRSTNTPPQSSTSSSTTGSVSNSTIPSPAPSPAAPSSIAPDSVNKQSIVNGSLYPNSSAPVETNLNGPVPNMLNNSSVNTVNSLSMMAQKAMSSQHANPTVLDNSAVAAAAAAAAASKSSTAASTGMQTSTVRLSPLLGLAPLGSKALTKDHHTQADMLMAAHQHMPHPSDSERLKHYLPRNPTQTPSHYPQTQPQHNDTVEFFQRLGTESLFFIFYYMEGTKAQYLAAKALKKQSWRFHTKYMMWFQRHDEPRSITDEYEQGTYIYFDYEKWGQRRKEGFTFEYRFLEDRDLN